MIMNETQGRDDLHPIQTNPFKRSVRCDPLSHKRVQREKVSPRRAANVPTFKGATLKDVAASPSTLERKFILSIHHHLNLKKMIFVTTRPQ